ncbi:MAG: peptidylprolyl isomerase [Caldibacillus sp.]
MKDKKWIFWVAGIGAVVLTAVILYFAINQDEAVALVDGEKITKEELTDRLISLYGEKVLNQLIVNKMIEIDAEKQGIEVSEDELNEELDKYYSMYGGEENFASFLEMSGFKLEDFKDDVKLSLLLDQILEERIEISDEEMKEYFEENKEDFAQEEQVEASHILVEDKETAFEVINKLNNGADFAELAKEYSIDEKTKDKGGELGYFGKGEMVKEFEEEVFAMEVNTISKPVETQYGFHVIKKTDHKPYQEANFEDVKEEVRQAILEQKKDEEYQKWLQEKMEEFKVVNSLSDNPIFSNNTGSDEDSDDADNENQEETNDDTEERTEKTEE